MSNQNSKPYWEDSTERIFRIQFPEVSPSMAKMLEYMHKDRRHVL
jgi:hypothetical protein